MSERVFMPFETSRAPGAFLRESSGVAELVQPVLLDPEVVRQLVEDGDPDLLLELAGAGKRLGEREPEGADPVGKRPRPVAALGQRDPLVEAEEVGILRVLVLDRDLDVPYRLPQLVG